MHISWYGHFLFRLTIQSQKNGQVNIVMDPFNKGSGVRTPKLEADILLLSHREGVDPALVSGNPFLIDGPGEYDIKQVFIRGIFSQNKFARQNTIYTIEAEDLELCHLGAFGQSELTNEQLEAIGDIDILFVPIGGIQTLNNAEAQKIINQIEPRIVIPMYYFFPGSKEKLEGLDKFLKTMGAKSVESQNKLIIKKKILPAEMQIVILKP